MGVQGEMEKPSSTGDVRQVNEEAVPCPHCGYMTAAQMGIVMKGTPPRHCRPGDVSICINCAGLAIFTASMRQRKMTYREELGLDSEMKNLLAIARAQVRALPPR